MEANPHSSRSPQNPASESSPEERKPPRSKRLFRALRSLILYVIAISILMTILASLRGPDLPDQAPDFSLPNLEDETVGLTQFRGQTVLLNFWATWCLPCRIEAPALSRLASIRPEIVVLGIAADGTPSELRDAADELGINYTVLRGDRETLRAYSVDTFPTTVVVGPEGQVKRAYTGLLLDPQLWWATR